LCYRERKGSKRDREGISDLAFSAISLKFKGISGCLGGGERVEVGRSGLQKKGEEGRSRSKTCLIGLSLYFGFMEF